MARTMMIYGGKLSRLLKLCRAIGSGGGAKLAALQSRLRASRRTVFRDMNQLESIGIRIELGDRGYRIAQSDATCRRILIEHQLRSVRKLLENCLK